MSKKQGKIPTLANDCSRCTGEDREGKVCTQRSSCLRYLTPLPKEGQRILMLSLPVIEIPCSMYWHYDKEN